MSANRNNDRWPFYTFAEELVLFSLWSRNREAVTEDGSEIRPVSAGDGYATGATDLWMAARTKSDSASLRYCAAVRGSAATTTGVAITPERSRIRA